MKPTYEELEARIAEQDKLIKQLLERIAHLEDQIDKNSKNSSMPPSSDQKPSHHSEKKRNKNSYHPGASRQLLPANVVTSREVRKVERCSKYGSSMKPTGDVQSWQQVELPEIEPLVHQIDLHTYKCPNCHREETP